MTVTRTGLFARLLGAALLPVCVMTPAFAGPSGPLPVGSAPLRSTSTRR